MEDNESSFSDWESVHDDDAERENPGGENVKPQIVLELPPEGFDGSFVGVGAAKYTSSNDSALCSPTSSFVQVTQTLPSSTSSYQYKSESDASSALLSNFEILSLSSGELVRRCKRCKYHNKNNSVICASCALALVANPNVDMDTQIALHLAAKEEEDARTMLVEAERKREQIYQDPLYDHASILANDIKDVCNNNFQTLPKEDFEWMVLEFVKQAVDMPPKKISFAYKCTPHSVLESIRTRGLPADQRCGMVKVSHSMGDALASIETLEALRGQPLCPIPESRVDGYQEEQSSLICLCWVIAFIHSEDVSPDNMHTCCSPTQTLPLAYFGSSSSKDDRSLTILLRDLQHTFQEFFVGSLELPIEIMNNAKVEVDEVGSECNKSCAAIALDGDEHDVATSSVDGCKHQLKVSETPNIDLKVAIDKEQTLKPKKKAKQSHEVTSFWDNETRLIRMKGRVGAIAAFNSGVLICCNDGDIIIMDEHFCVYKTLTRGSHSSYWVSCLATAPSAQDNAGQAFATGDMKGAVVVYKLLSGSSNEGETSTSIFDNGRHMPIVDVCFLPKGTAIAAANWLRECQLWSLTDKSCICSLKGERPEPSWSEHRLNVASFSADGYSLASVAEGSQYIHLWRFNGKPQQLNGHIPSPDVIGRQEYRIRALAFSADMKYLASGANDCTIRIWDIRTDDIICIKVIRVGVALSCLTFSPDSMLVTGGCTNGDIKAWDLLPRNNEALHTFNSNSGSIKSLVFLNKKTIGSIGWTDCTLRVWSLAH